MPLCLSSARMASLALRPYLARSSSLPWAWMSVFAWRHQREAFVKPEAIQCPSEGSRAVS
jgi:hypothetical protein